MRGSVILPKRASSPSTKAGGVPLRPRGGVAGVPLTPTLSRQRRAVRGIEGGCEVTILCNQRGSPWPDLVWLGPATHVFGAEIVAGSRR
jgi:hypothetical protein